MLGDVDGALADHGRALELQPGYLPALIGRSKLLNARNSHAAALADADLGRQREAPAAVDRATALAPSRPVLHAGATMSSESWRMARSWRDPMPSAARRS
jgi:hypothetical protein